jgi:hypothetical protein
VPILPGFLWEDRGVDLELVGKRAVVTGGSQGIGLAVGGGAVGPVYY